MAENNECGSNILTVSEVARLLRVHVRSVYRLIEEAGLPAVNLGTGRRPRYRIRKEDLDSWLSERAKQSKAR